MSGSLGLALGDSDESSYLMLGVHCQRNLPRFNCCLRRLAGAPPVWTLLGFVFFFFLHFLVLDTESYPVVQADLELSVCSGGHPPASAALALR